MPKHEQIPFMTHQEEKLENKNFVKIHLKNINILQILCNFQIKHLFLKLLQEEEDNVNLSKH